MIHPFSSLGFTTTNKSRLAKSIGSGYGSNLQSFGLIGYEGEATRIRFLNDASDGVVI